MGHVTQVTIPRDKRSVTPLMPQQSPKRVSEPKILSTSIRPRRARVVLSGLAFLALLGCATAPDRPAVSSYSCMVAVRGSVPPQGYDKRAHCLLSAGIAQRCSVVEADLAGLGKEFSDLFSSGDASWDDWRADRAGIHCAKRGRDSDALAACCAEAGY